MYFKVAWKDVPHSKIPESQTQTHQLPICLTTWCKKNCVFNGIPALLHFQIVSSVGLAESLNDAMASILSVICP